MRGSLKRLAHHANVRGIIPAHAGLTELDDHLKPLA